jgi:hypothetical protein
MWRGRSPSSIAICQVARSMPVLVSACVATWRSFRCFGSACGAPTDCAGRRAAPCPGWLINEVEPNQRLHRYVARGLAWPAIDTTDWLSDVADVTFFSKLLVIIGGPSGSGQRRYHGAWRVITDGFLGSGNLAQTIAGSAGLKNATRTGWPTTS